MSIGEWNPDVCAVGVPVISPDGSGVFAFNCGAPSFQMTRERLETMLEFLTGMTGSFEELLRLPAGALKSVVKLRGKLSGLLGIKK